MSRRTYPMTYFAGDRVPAALENSMFSDGGKGADRIIRDVDNEDELWKQEQERRYHAAEMRVMRKMPYCLEVFREISINGKDRFSSILNMSLRDLRRTKGIGMPQKSGTSVSAMNC